MTDTTEAMSARPADDVPARNKAGRWRHNTVGHC